MPTLSADVCPCGTEMEYTGPNMNMLTCDHCDRGCKIQQTLKEPCIRCESFNEQWQKKIEGIYGPGRAY